MDGSEGGCVPGGSESGCSACCEDRGTPRCSGAPAGCRGGEAPRGEARAGTGGPSCSTGARSTVGGSRRPAGARGPARKSDTSETSPSCSPPSSESSSMRKISGRLARAAEATLRTEGPRQPKAPNLEGKPHHVPTTPNQTSRVHEKLEPSGNTWAYRPFAHRAPHSPHRDSDQRDSIDSCDADSPPAAPRDS